MQKYNNGKWVKVKILMGLSKEIKTSGFLMFSGGIKRDLVA